MNDHARQVMRGAQNTKRSLICPAISCMALFMLAGCTMSSGTDVHTPSASIDPDGVHGVYTPSWFEEKSDKAGVDARWLSEAQVRISDVEARRAGAQAALVQADAERAERFAASDAQMQQYMSDHTSGRARASMLRESYRTKLDEMLTRSEAQQDVYSSQIRRDQTMLGAQTKEWRGEIEGMRAEADSEMEYALAQHEEMLAQRDGVESRGRVDLNRMRQVIDLRESRTHAQLMALRAEASATGEQSNAMISELDQQIDTEGRVTQATVDGMTRRAASIKEQARASAMELRAEANAVEETETGNSLNARNAVAKSRFDSAAADARLLRSRADAFAHQSLAQVERARAESRAALDKAELGYNNQLDSINSGRRASLAQIEANRAEAGRIERSARAEFLKAEAQARADAIRERSSHAKAVSEEEFNVLVAQASVEAAQINARVSREVANQLKVGNITLPLPEREGKYSNRMIAPELILPSLGSGNVDPQHVVNLKTELARAVLTRRDMDMTEANLFASLDEQLANAQAAWQQAQSDAEVRDASTSSLRRRGEAKADRALAAAERLFDEARAEFDSAKVGARSFKREATAEVIELRAEADSIETRASVAASQLLAQAEAIQQIGETTARSLAAKRDAERIRGTALSSQILADAGSLEESESATVALMAGQAAAAERILYSELARMDQAASSFRAIAQATFDESIVESDAYEQITRFRNTELAASTDALRRMADADLNYRRELASSNRLLAQASVERELADIESRLGIDSAQEMMARAGIDRDARLASASIAEQFTIADAEELATKSLFDSRVVLTRAGRNRDFASSYLRQQQDFQRTQQALAAAAAFEEMSATAMARLDSAVRSFERTENPDWASRLATPPLFASPTNVAIVNEDAERSLILPPEFVNVPIEFVTVPDPE